MSVSPDWRPYFFCIAKRNRGKKKLPPTAFSCVARFNGWQSKTRPIKNQLGSNSRLPTSPIKPALLSAVAEDNLDATIFCTNKNLRAHYYPLLTRLDFE